MRKIPYPILILYSQDCDREGVPSVDISWNDEIKFIIARKDNPYNDIESMKGERPTSRAQRKFINTCGAENVNMLHIQASVNRLESLQYTLPINITDYTGLSAEEMQNVSLTSCAIRSTLDD